MRHQLLALLACCSLATACTQEQACTLAGCGDQFTLQLTVPGGTAPRFDLDVVLDGVEVACPAPTTSQPTLCDHGVTLWLREDQTCTDTTTGAAVTHSCVGNGQLVEVMEVRGAPVAVGITLRQGGTSRNLGTLTPAYQPNRPNGPDCEPTCKAATETRIIEAWP